jgi:transposase
MKKKRPYKKRWYYTSAHKSNWLWLPEDSGKVKLNTNQSSDCDRRTEELSWSTVNINEFNGEFKYCDLSLVGTKIVGGENIREKHETAKNKKDKRLTSAIEARGFKRKTFDDQDCIPSSRRIEIIPGKNRKILDRWITATRKVWNICNHEIKSGKSEINFTTLRNKFILESHMSADVKKRMKPTLLTQKRIREDSLKKLIASYKSGETRIRKGQITKFNVKQKNSKSKKQYLGLPDENAYIYDGYLHVFGLDLKIKEKNIKNHDKLPALKCVKYGSRFFIHICKFSEFKFKETSIENTKDIVSLDVGINIFATFFSPEATWGEIGIDVTNKLNTIYKKQERIKKRVTTIRKRNRALDKTKSKITNLVNDLQWKTAHWLLSNFRNILVSRLYVNKLKGLSRRHADDLKHCLFADRLAYKSMFYLGRTVHEGTEPYTSSVCTKCLSDKITKGDILKCKSCGFKIHRDLGGARNFLIKYL